jgi:hypothetical protein
MYRLGSWAIITLQDARGTEYFEILNVLGNAFGQVPHLQNKTSRDCCAGHIFKGEGSGAL